VIRVLRVLTAILVLLAGVYVIYGVASGYFYRLVSIPPPWHLLVSLALLAGLGFVTFRIGVPKRRD
jgi:hypothetical protein